MRTAYYPGECPAPPDGSVVTIGAFDGVHLGHRRLIERVRRTATDIGAVATIVTFDRHPASVVRPESAPLLLTDLDQKLALLEACGADLTLVVHFDAERAAERAEDFVGEVLVGCLNARAVIVGHDFHFGHNREGDVPLLQRMGAQMGFDVTGIRLLGAGGATTSGVPDGTGTDAGGGEYVVWRRADLVNPHPPPHRRRRCGRGGRPPRSLVRAARAGRPR